MKFFLTLYMLLERGNAVYIPNNYFLQNKRIEDETVSVPKNQFLRMHTKRCSFVSVKKKKEKKHVSEKQVFGIGTEKRNRNDTKQGHSLPSVVPKDTYNACKS